MRLSVLGVPLGFCDAPGGTAKFWLLRSDEEVDASDSARFRFTSSLSNSACMFVGSVGDKIFGSPWGLANGS
jgi:hypothetical protein